MRPAPGRDVYEVFGHTADIGLRIRAERLEELLEQAGRALCSLFVENVETVEPRETIELRIEGVDRTYLLFDLLNELLYLFETKGLLLPRLDVRLDPDGLQASARGERWSEQRHRLDHEVKAITYHGLEVHEVDGGWEARVIVDI